MKRGRSDSIKQAFSKLMYVDYSKTEMVLPHLCTYLLGWE